MARERRNNLDEMEIMLPVQKDRSSPCQPNLQLGQNEVIHWPTLPWEYYKEVVADVG